MSSHIVERENRGSVCFPVAATGQELKFLAHPPVPTLRQDQHSVRKNQCLRQFLFYSSDYCMYLLYRQSPPDRAEEIDSLRETYSITLRFLAITA